MKSKVCILNIIILAFIAIFFSWFLSNDIFLGDDISEILHLSQKTAKYNIDGLFTSVITKLFCVNIPLLLKIHPHQFSMTAGAFVRGLNLALLCGIIPLFMFLGREKKYYIILGTVFSAFYLCYSFSNLDLIFSNLLQLPNYEAEGSFVLITEYAHHFGQILSLILGLSFLYILINCFINENVLDKKYLIPCSVLAFLGGFSSLYVSVVVGTVIFCICLYSLILNFFINKISYSDFKEADKTSIIPLAAYFTGMFLLIIYNKLYVYSLFKIKLFFGIKAVIKGLLATVPLEIATIIILCTVVYFMALNKTTYLKRAVFTSFSTLTGIFVYLYLFSSKGKLLPIVLADSFVLIRLTLLCLIFLLIGVCIKELSTEPKVRKIVISGLVVIYGLFSLVQIPFVFTTMNLWRTINEENKITLYCIEKMYRFYSLIGKTAFLPNDALLRIMKINTFINDKSVEDEIITSKTSFKYTDFTTGYYETFYKNPRIVAYRFIEPVTAIKIFNAYGGQFTKEEVQKPNFQDLYDKRFVIENIRMKK